MNLSRNLYTLATLIVLFTFEISDAKSQNDLGIFENLLNKTWVAEGTWGDGSAFKQELYFEKELGGKLIHVTSHGFIDKEQTKTGKRNIGIRSWSEEEGKVKFTEYDVFGGVTTGTVESNEKGDLIYSYNYGGYDLTDYWEKVNDNEYLFTVGLFNNGKWESKYLETKMENKKFKETESAKRAFDFWIGNWDVYQYNGDKKYGQNIITSILDGNAIEENYFNDQKKFSGKSLNKYNPDLKKWEQFWIDTGGLTLKLEGHSPKPGHMVMTGITYQEEEEVKNKIEWLQLEDGSIRQTWFQKTSSQDEWNIIFDGHYKKRSE